MNNPTFLKSQVVNIAQEKAYQRMGYGRNHSADLSLPRDNTISEELSLALNSVRIHGAYLISPILSLSDGIVSIDKNISFNSANLAQMLTGCKDILIFSSTISKDFMDTIKQKTKSQELSSAIIYDAVATEAVEEGLNIIMSKVNTLVAPEKKAVLIKRFSAGFGDLDISNQKLIYDLLQLKQLGVKISETFMLNPSKSVTAITGIK